MSVSVDGITRVFDNRGIAGVHGVSLELRRGETVAIMGPNGSGKTTLLKLLSRQIPPDTGSVTGGAILFSGQAPEADQRVLEYLVDSSQLDIDREKKVQLARDLADIFEVTFQLRQNLSQLSAGQLQKILLAAELMQMPQGILLDEPFSQLDPFTRADILTSLFNYTRQREVSVLMVTHDLEDALRFSDRLGILNFGKLLDLRPPSEVLFEPRASFVARFIGYKNFIPVQDREGLWVTPWGNWSFEGPGDQTEVLMVIPDHAWRLDPDSPMVLQIEGMDLVSTGWLLRLRGGDRVFSWRVSHRQKEQLANPLRLSPIWEDCFLLPL